MPTDLEAKLTGLAALFGAIEFDPEYERTGFQSVLAIMPEAMIGTVLHLQSKYTPAPFLDLGSGDCAPSLLMAAAGFPSYGVDINPRLIERAHEMHRLAVREGFIDKKTIFKAAEGTMFGDWHAPMEEMISKWAAALEPYYHKGLPKIGGKNPYPEVGMTPKKATFLYSFPWDLTMPLLYTYLANKGNPQGAYILPHLDIEDINLIDLPSRDLNAAARRGLVLEPWDAKGGMFTTYRRIQNK